MATTQENIQTSTTDEELQFYSGWVSSDQELASSEITNGNQSGDSSADPSEEEWVEDSLHSVEDEVDIAKEDSIGGTEVETVVDENIDSQGDTSEADGSDEAPEECLEEVEEVEIETTKRPIWTSPMLKFGVVGFCFFLVVIILAAVFGSVGTVDLGKQSQTEQALNDSSSESETMATPTNEADQQKIGELETQVALGSQADAMEQLRERKQQAQANDPSQQTQKSAKPSSINVGRPPTESNTVSSPVSPTYGSVPRTQYVPPSRISPVAIKPPSPAQIPFPAASPSPSPETDLVEETPVEPASYGQLPTSEPQPQQSPQINTDSSNPTLAANSLSRYTPVANVNPSVNPLIAEQEAFLQGHKPVVVEPGTAKAVVETNGIFNGPVTQFRVRLAGDLKNTDGSTSLSQGTQLLVQTQGILPNRMVEASVVAIIDGQNLKSVPAGAIQVVRSGGKPLKAKSSKSGGSKFLKQFLLGAVSQGSQFITQGDQQSFSNANGFFTSSSKPKTNIKTIGASLLQGGTQALLPQVQNGQSEAEAQPEIFMIPTGEKVQIQVIDAFTL